MQPVQPDDSAAAGGEPASMRQEVQFLQRKVKYIQGVSTVFRQKIAMIIRECAKQPELFGSDLQKMYAAAVGDLLQAEADGSLGPAGIQIGSPKRRHPRTDQAKEDVRKAHHLCQILQEKNVAKQREIQLSKELDALKAKHSDLLERHDKLVELQSTGAGASLAQRELYDRRVDELEAALNSSRQEIVKLRSSAGLDGTPAAMAADDGSLSKQNIMLRSRLSKMKDEVAALKHNNADVAQNMQVNVDTMLDQQMKLKRDVASREDTIRRLMQEKGDLNRDLVASRGQEETLRDQIVVLRGEVDALRQHGSQASQRTGGGEGSHAAAESFARRNEELEDLVSSLRDQLREAHTAAVEKDLKIESLGAQMTAFRTRMEAFESHAEQQRAQSSMVDDVQHRIMSAVSEIAKVQTSSTLSGQMSELSDKLHGLEGVEMQLRQKEDEMMLLEDELAASRGRADELQDSLLSVSSLFLALPKSVDHIERLVIELDAYKEEVARAAEQQEPPNVLRLEGVVDLRCLESEAKRREAQAKNREKLRASSVEAGGVASNKELTGGAFGGVASLSDDVVAALAVSDDDDDDFGELGLGDVQPPPALVDITSTLIASGIAASPSAAPGRAGSVGSAASPLPPAPGGVSEADARLTFQLFDERGEGKLSRDVVDLCVRTLGLSPSIVPAKGEIFGLDEFLAMCQRAS